MNDIIHKFTKRVPHWQPRVEPVVLAEATEAQLEALQVTPSNTKVSDYVLVLAHDVETLKVRSPLFNAVMYDKGGLSRAERELGALGASVVNGCIYCAAVHALRHSQIIGSDEIIDAIFLSGVDVKLSTRNQAIFDFAVKLTHTPSTASADDMQALRNAGLLDTEILDLVLSVSLFGWANRLMHVLGDPVQAATTE